MLISPGPTARSFCGRTGNYDPPWPPPSLRPPFLFRHVPRRHWWFGYISGYRVDVVYNWKVCGENEFCLARPNWEIFAPVRVTGVRPTFGMKKNNSARCWCPSVTLIVSFLSSPAPKSKRETVRNDVFVIQIQCELSQISPLEKVLLSSLKWCAPWLSEFVCLGQYKCWFIIKSPLRASTWRYNEFLSSTRLLTVLFVALTCTIV